ncbi:MAG: hypothetical protein ACOYCD_09340 [Kiritimatiellia bacterium]|jgi:hypothetical protein
MSAATYPLEGKNIIAAPTQPAVIGAGACLENLPYIEEFIVYYFSTRCGCRPKVMSIAEALKASGSRIILATKAEADIAGFHVGQINHDGFTIQTKADGADNLLIYCVGNNEQGIKYGLYRLILESEYENQTLFLPGPLDINVSPLFEKRVILESASAPMDAHYLNVKSSSGEIPPSPLNSWPKDLTASKKYSPAWWTEAKNRDWVKMMDSFGFNTLQLGFIYNAHSWPGATPEQAIKSLKTRFQENKRLGNENIQFFWGAGVYSKENRTWNMHVCLNSPQGRQEALEYYDYMAGEFGPMADCIITHWGDPGGCKSGDCACSVKTPQEYHNQIVNAFRKHNPKIQSFFSLWSMFPNEGKDFERLKDRRYWQMKWGWSWKHIRGIEDILDSGILPDDVGIAAHQEGGALPHGIWLDYLMKIIRAKRKVGMWVWYLFDFEINTGLHINYRRSAKYLKELAETDYVKHIQWSQCEVNRSGDWNTVSNMVGGMLELDVRLDPDRLVREFCASIAGKKNAAKVKKALDAIRKTRNYLTPRTDGPDSAGQDNFGKGSEDPARDYKLAAEALKGLESISLSENHIPKLPYLELVFNFQTMLEDLKTNLAVIRDYNQARIKVLELAKTKDTMSEAELIKKLKELDPRLLPRTYDIGIAPEVHRAGHWKTFVQKRLQRNPDGCPESDVLPGLNPIP